MATENILLKFTSDLSGLKSAIDELVKMGKVTEEDKKKYDVLLGTVEGIDDALKEAGIEAGKFSKEVTKGADSGKSLRGQLADAKNEAVRLSQAFGPFSKEAREAAKRAAAIKDEIGDLNDTLDALNPEAKLNAFVKLGQGVQGAFQVATGALQVFGVENERITKLAQQFQGVLNVTQGINSVLQLKDVYGQLRLVLGVTTTAQKGLAAATAADAVATNAATVATKGFTAALAANPFTAVAVALAALIATLIILKDKTDEYKLSEEELTRIKKDGVDATEGLQKAEDDLAIARDKNATFDIQRRENRNKLEEDLIKLFDNQRIAQDELNAAQAKFNELGTGASRALVKERQDRLNLAIQVKQDTDLAIENRKKEFAAINTTIGIREKEATLIAEKTKKEKEGKKIIDETLDVTLKLLNALSLPTNNAIKDSFEDLFKLTDEEFQKVKDLLNLLEADAFEVRDAILAVNRELANIEPITVDIKASATDLNKELFKREEELTEKIREENEKRKELASQLFNIAASGSLNIAQSVSDLNNQLYANDLANLQQSLEDGFLTEKQYNDRVKALKIKQFEENKKLSIAQTIIATAQAVVNALTIVPASAAVTASFFAASVGALNLAKILSTEPPSFKKGTLNFQGGNVDADGGRMAILHPREAVIPADRNMEYHPTIKAVYNRQIKASEINGFVEARLRGKIENRVSADIDVRKLSKALQKSNTVELANAGMVGKVIAKEMLKQYDIRRQ